MTNQEELALRKFIQPLLEKFDLSDSATYEEIINVINSDYFKSYVSLLRTLYLYDFDFSTEDLIKVFKDEILKYHNNLHKSDDKKSELITPNAGGINVNTGIQIHHLVQEYVDTQLIKQYPDLPEDARNAVYGVLYDYGCWLVKK